MEFNKWNSTAETASGEEKFKGSRRGQGYLLSHNKITYNKIT